MRKVFAMCSSICWPPGDSPASPVKPPQSKCSLGLDKIENQEDKWVCFQRLNLCPSSGPGSGPTWRSRGWSSGHLSAHSAVSPSPSPASWTLPPARHIYWYCNDRMVNHDVDKSVKVTTYSTTSQTTESKLTFSNASKRKEGNYTCSSNTMTTFQIEKSGGHSDERQERTIQWFLIQERCDLFI